MPNIVEILLKARDEASKPMEKVTKSMGKMASQLRNVGLKMTGIGTAILTSIGLATIRMGEFAGEIQKMAAQAGTGTDDLQRLRYVVEQNEASAENLIMGLTRLRAAAVEASSGGKEAYEKFARLGIAFKNTDGSIRDTKEIFLDLANVFATHKNDPEIMAKAFELLGTRGGKELAVVLGLGRKGIEDFMAKAKGVIPPQTLRALDDAADRWAEMKLEIKAALAEGLKPILPYFQRFTEFISLLAKKFEALSPGVKEIIGKFVLLNSVILAAFGGPLLAAAGGLSLIKTGLEALAILKWGTIVSGLESFQGRLATLNPAILTTVLALTGLIATWSAVSSTIGIVKTLWDTKQISIFGKGVDDINQRLRAHKITAEQAKEELEKLREEYKMNERQARIASKEPAPWSPVGVMKKTAAEIKEAMGGIAEAAEIKPSEIKIPEIKIPEIPKLEEVKKGAKRMLEELIGAFPWIPPAMGMRSPAIRKEFPAGGEGGTPISLHFNVTNREQIYSRLEREFDRLGV